VYGIALLQPTKQLVPTTSTCRPTKHTHLVVGDAAAWLRNVAHSVLGRVVDGVPERTTAITQK
jgi:hypothetical protein